MFLYKVVIESKKHFMEQTKHLDNNQESIVDILNQDAKENYTEGPIHFTSGNPTIETIEGKIHLFKLKNKGADFQNNNTPKYLLPVRDNTVVLIVTGRERKAVMCLISPLLHVDVRFCKIHCRLP